MENKSGPGPLVWAVALVTVAALAFLGWRSNQPRPTAAPVRASAPAKPKPAKQKPEAPIVTEVNGGLPG
ncbi:MAG: hypothetical protein IT347_09830 [Candidatus Eisenbacteria bacterium]|nr:hypothetical protein [Candidatus Eisenbacteria bacterium]